MPGTSIKLYKQIKFIFISFNLLIPKFSVFGGYLLYSEKFINYNDWNASYLNGDYLYKLYSCSPTLNLCDVGFFIPHTHNTQFQYTSAFRVEETSRAKNMINQKGAMRVPDRITA